MKDIIDVVEQKRLSETETNSLEKMGSVPQRATVGHGPGGGLQRGRQRLGLSPVTRALTGVPMRV